MSAQPQRDAGECISAALDREQALAEDATQYDWTFLGGWLQRDWPDIAGYVTAQDPARTLRRITEDRKTLAEHTPERCGVAVKGLWVSECIGRHPCKALRSLAARYDVEVPRD